MVRILLVDDHALFRAGLRLLLGSMQRDAHVLEAGTLQEALALARQHPDLALSLLDLTLAGERGFDGISAIKQLAPAAAIVVVSAAQDMQTIRSCLDAGAMSFVPKSMPPDTLHRALQRVLAGEVFLPEDVQRASASRAATPTTLSPRQRDVLRGLSRGMPTKLIARELHLSEHTVKEHIGLLFQALGVRNRTEAVIIASGLGLSHQPVIRKAL